ncbi:MAG TPA: 16S rRNA (uracil(1498)-N(3))-methyltransferase [Moraxellaceae bacterium]|nr:16S rRNA (uracil(1498)-N(3))-methyltransferase [Moraxellaceae bacterium]
MNLLLLTPDDCPAPGRARLTGRRLQHVREVHRAAAGDCLRVGLLGGLMGEGVITALDRDALELEFVLEQAPPPKLPLTLLLGLPRPKMLKRVFQTVAAMGVRRLVLMNSYRVEKSFWDSPWLAPEAVREQLLLGLEQARDTVLPEVALEPRFKPFVEDRLPGLCRGSVGLVAHPVAAEPCPVAIAAPVTLAIGPEGGFIPYEVDLLQAAGFRAVHLGPRILRVETAVTALVARLYP